MYDEPDLEEDFEEEEEGWFPCSCPLCFRTNEVEGGGKCGDCFMNIHQG